MDSNGQEAVTHFQLVQQHEGYALLALALETGRTHQIRVHLAYAGCPVVGDRMYGKSDSRIKRQALHAAKIEFIHPATGEKLSVAAPLPKDIANIMGDVEA